MGQQPPFRVRQAALRGRRAPAGIEDTALGRDDAGFVRNGPDKRDLELERGVADPDGQGGMDAASHAGIKQRCGVAPVYRAKRIVVLELRRALEHSAPEVHLGELEAQQLCDRRIG